MTLPETDKPWNVGTSSRKTESGSPSTISSLSFADHSGAPFPPGNRMSTDRETGLFIRG